MTLLDKIYDAMLEFDRGDPRRIQHFIKVHSLAARIGRGEGLSADDQIILEAAALVHDIGIHPAEEKYGSCTGRYQEELGPAPARALVTACGMDGPTADRVAWLVGHHHTYDPIEGMDHQILVEADFLVNLFEDDAPPQAVRTTYEKIFQTKTGRALCRQMFPFV